MRKIAMMLAMGLSFVTMGSSARADSCDTECTKEKDGCVMERPTNNGKCVCGKKDSDGVCRPEKK